MSNNKIDAIRKENRFLFKTRHLNLLQARIIQKGASEKVFNDVYLQMLMAVSVNHVK